MILRLAQICLGIIETNLPTPREEWNSLTALAETHGVAALLWTRVQHAELPAAARERLRARYRQNLVRCIALQQEEKKICETLAAREVAVWPLKGTGLSEQLYGDAAARDTTDIDLLIRPQDFLACDAALEALGYARRGISAEQARELQEVFYAKRVEAGKQGSGEAIQPDRIANGDHADEKNSFKTLAVDLHLGMMPYDLPDPLADRIRAQGTSAENLLVYLAVNAVVHRFAGMKYLLDIAAHLRATQSNLNWDAVISAGRGLAFAPGVWFALRFAGELAKTEIPSAVEQVFRPSAAQRLAAEEILGHSARDVLSRAAILSGARGAPALLVSTRTLRQAVHVAWRMIWPAPGYLRQEVGAQPDAALWPLYVQRFFGKLRT